MDATSVKRVRPIVGAVLSTIYVHLRKKLCHHLRTMFNPNQQQVREFFCSTYQKYIEHRPLTALEIIAADWIKLHPEYHSDLCSIGQALNAIYPPEGGRTNPFLHLSMHLSISEQLSIDQPKGIQTANKLLCERFGDAHEAAHQIMECLGEVVWNAQRTGLPPDSDAYINCLKSRSTRR